MDEIKQRLKDASEACIRTFEAWRAKPGDNGAREALQEAVHELRKVGARLEIELAVSDRKTHGSDPIPIPAHRAARRQGPESEQPGDDEGNRQQQQRPARDQRGGGRPVQIRQREESSEAEGEDNQRRSKPLSLKRSGGGEAE